MNHHPKKERLLADILGEQSEAEFREALLGQTLRRSGVGVVLLITYHEFRSFPFTSAVPRSTLRPLRDDWPATLPVL